MCFIHAGTHKTGTTSIQAFLAANRETLLNKGLFIPVSGSNGEPEFACHHGVVRELSARPQLEGDDGALEQVAAELSESTAAMSCLTSEDFSLLYDRPDLLVRLRDTIRSAGFSPRIIMYLRPQASYSVALYAENVDAGYRVPFADFIRSILTSGSYAWDGGAGPPFDYGAALEPFDAVFGRDALVLRRFVSDAPDDALLRSFMRILWPELHTLQDFVRPVKRANRTSTFATVLGRLGVTHRVGEDVRFAPLTLRQLARLWMRFRAANRKLAVNYGVGVPVLDLVDVGRALPMRRTARRTIQLLQARRALDSVRTNADASK